MTDPRHRSFLRWLSVAFAFELFLVAVVAATAIYSLRVLRAEVREIVQLQNERIALIHEMRMAVRERMLRVHMLLLETDPFKQDEYRLMIDELAARFVTARSKVDTLSREAEERAALAASRAASMDVAAVVDKVLALHEAGRLEEARQLLLTQAVPRQHEVLKHTDGLLALYAEKGRRAIERGHAMYEHALALLTGLGVVAGALTLATGVTVVRRSRRDRQRLLDEIAAHAETESRLRALSATLEEQVAARTRALQQAMDQLREAQRIGRMGHWEWDISSGHLHWSPEIYHLFGLDPEGEPLTYERFLERVHPEDRGKLSAAVDEAVATGRQTEVVHRILLPDGTVRYMRERGVAERDALGRVVRMLGTVQDVTETECLQRRLWELAHVDALTGLPNRLLLMDRISQAVAGGHRLGQRFAVVLFDLDGFKEVNDQSGHHTGDLLLKAVADRLRQMLRETDTLARYGGDEFVVILPGVTSADELETVCSKIRACFDEPFLIDGREARVGASLGVACFPEDGRTADELLRRADAAMYGAKRARAAPAR